ncbi:IS481 family transposase [Microbacterium capsulatum]|uniref:IS481 family transposase n=1 Tax=Microbacterium capsulatum TaxID=3041921 RepID=A0ABU0XGR7_9MICO|nr:IS481 family transposase [Microbacterium sp. ASV81]MDQ4212856.1 IS481 family transposase [Microbacterium sp. ASV81]MDQ4213360.1 IS481 family transposase [Microbacterium sp. ASV81]MDQ4215450.1 IS481 family transposase [Microbacterium sp. ASV81]MDQ4215854.1 IS481 family transposase [Microbacterium sp. ASV81]
MAKYEVLIKAVTVQKLSYGEVARRYGVSKTLVHKLHHRWLEEGDGAFEPRSRRPHASPNRTAPTVRERILALRDQLAAAGLDNGADTIAELLARERVTVSRATVWRILTAAGRVSPQPQKRPRSSWRRFTADRPNELWQSDFTHVTLTTGQEVEVIGWLDDHSRYLLHLTAHRRVTGRTVTDTFTTTATEHGYPAATLTDNGMVYTTRLARGGRGRGDGGGNGFETLLATLGITQKNGKPFKPTTQGKIERFWQTLKKHLATRPARSLLELQATLDAFRDHYNHARPHRAIGRHTPAFAYQLIPKATPTAPEDPGIWRVRYDTIDNDGKITLRHTGRLLHLGIGRAHTRVEIICLVHNDNATIIATATGEILADFTLDPTRSYQRKNG